MNSHDKLAAITFSRSGKEIADARRREKLRQKYARREDGAVSLGQARYAPEFNVPRKSDK